MQRTRSGVKQAKEFGRRVQRRRAEMKPFVSQEHLAELAGVHRTYIGHVERGEVNPTLWNVIRIAAALDVDPSDLVAGLSP